MSNKAALWVEKCREKSESGFGTPEFLIPPSHLQARHLHACNGSFLFYPGLVPTCAIYPSNPGKIQKDHVTTHHHGRSLVFPPVELTRKVCPDPIVVPKGQSKRIRQTNQSLRSFGLYIVLYKNHTFQASKTTNPNQEFGAT